MRAFLVTVCLAATIHLLIIFIVFLTTGNWRVVNPVDFLGVSTIDPSLRDNKLIFFVSWAVLIGLFFAILGISLAKNRRQEHED